MNRTSNSLSLLINNQSLLESGKRQQKEGERFLRFSLQPGVNGLIPLADLQGTIEVAIQDILPVPQVTEFWLGIVNWQGEAIWIVDLAGLLGASHWCQKDPLTVSGMAILIKVEDHTIGLLVEQVKSIETYDRKLCLPITDINSADRLRSRRDPRSGSLLTGYFLDEHGEPSMLLDITSLRSILQS